MKTKSVIPEFRKLMKFCIGKQKLGIDEISLCVWESKAYKDVQVQGPGYFVIHSD